MTTFTIAHKKINGSLCLDKHKKYFSIFCAFDALVAKFMINDLGAKWERDSRCWKVAVSPRSIAVLELLTLGRLPNNSATHDWTPHVPHLMSHQYQIVNYALSRLGCIIAADMGCGKTLAAFEVINYLGGHWLWLSPKSIIPSTLLEMQKWGFEFSLSGPSLYSNKAVLTFSTYDKKYQLQNERLQGIICDEASMVKNPSSNRTKRLVEFVNSMRLKNKNFRICLMTGTPAPKDPTDLWQLAELAQPGFIRFCNKKRMLESMAHLRHHSMSHMYQIVAGWKHDEVQKFAEALDPIRLVILAKNCLDLPEQIFITKKIQPSKEIRQQAKLITDNIVNPAQCLNLLRQLSDGFYYETQQGTPDGSSQCPLCQDTGAYPTPEGVVECDCRFAGPRIKKAFRIHSKKLEALEEWLVKAEEDERIIIFAPFLESLDMICEYVALQDWDFIRLDGKGWSTSLNEVNTPAHLLARFQSRESGSNKIAFVANPACGGFGLNLTAARIIVFYSNSFHGIHRMQGIKRNHRIGSRGSTIVDLNHLGVDDLVMKNLNNKITLQSITMKDIQETL